MNQDQLFQIKIAVHFDAVFKVTILLCISQL